MGLGQKSAARTGQFTGIYCRSWTLSTFYFILSNVGKQCMRAINRGASQVQMSRFKSRLSPLIGYDVWGKLLIFSSILLLICNIGLLVVVIITTSEEVVKKT